MVLGSWIVSLTVRSTDLTDVGQGLGISSELHFSKKKKIKKNKQKHYAEEALLHSVRI